MKANAIKLCKRNYSIIADSNSSPTSTTAIPISMESRWHMMSGMSGMGMPPIATIGRASEGTPCRWCPPGQERHAYPRGSPNPRRWLYHRWHCQHFGGCHITRQSWCRLHRMRTIPLYHHQATTLSHPRLGGLSPHHRWDERSSPDCRNRRHYHPRHPRHHEDRRNGHRPQRNHPQRREPRRRNRTDSQSDRRRSCTRINKKFKTKNKYKQQWKS